MRARRTMTQDPSIAIAVSPTSATLGDIDESKFEPKERTIKQRGRGSGAKAGQPVKFTPARKMEFLKLLAETGLIAMSAQAVGFTHMTIRNHRDRDPEFARGFDVAMEIFTDSLRQHAVRRATVGEIEPIVFQGKRQFEPVRDDLGQPVVIGGIDVVQPATVRKYSDRLLELLLKRYDEQFKDRVDVTGNVQGTVAHSVELRELPKAARRKLLELCDMVIDGEAIDVTPED